MTDLQNLTVAQLSQLIPIKEQIESLTAQFNAITAGAPSTKVGRRGQRKMSRYGRAAIAAGQKARWAKIKGKAMEVMPKKRRKMSTAGKVKIAAAARKRWAEAKAEGKNRL
jgi:hypothetical protein